MIIESERIRLADINNAYAIILKNMLSVMLQPGVDPLVSLEVLKYLDKLKTNLEKKHGVNSETDEAEAYLLKGPHLRNEESNMVSIKVTANTDGSASVQLPFNRDC